MFNYSPSHRNIIPVGGEGIKIQPGGMATIDFGIKRAGRLYFYMDRQRDTVLKDLQYVYASDPRVFKDMWDCFADDQKLTGRMPTYVRGQPFGNLKNVIPVSSEAYLLEDTLTVLSGMQIKNNSSETVLIHKIELEYTAAPYHYTGGFSSSDSLVNQCWAMGAYTVELCSQPSNFTQRSLTGPLSDYVIWDGVRRDKDIWGGDLRPAALTSLYAFDRPEIIKNTLQILLDLQHKEGPEKGIIPGSGSYGQIFYEWTMWWLVNVWEYVIHTGDLAYLHEIRPSLDQVKKWMENKMEEDGLISGLNSWMYTLDAEGKISGLAMAQKAALDALANLYKVLKEENQYKDCLRKSSALKKSILSAFSSSGTALLTMLPAGTQRRDHFSIDGNLWSILHDVVDGKRAGQILSEIKSKFWTDKGSINVYPIFEDEKDGQWWSKQLDKELTVWKHNNNIWPYMGAYEVLARFLRGQISEGLDVLKRIGKAHLDQGHYTYWEMMYVDGSLPYGAHGDILSNCHAWGGTGSYALQAYVGGVRPLDIGFEKAIIQPNLGPLDWIYTKVPTPFGTIEVEAENLNGQLKGHAKIPKGIEANLHPSLNVM